MKATVMLVDDSRVARMMARAAVERLVPSAVIIECGTGEAALAAATATPPDFVLMDVNMPGLGGIATARQLRQRYPAAVVSLLTANIQDPVREQAEEVGVGFIAKPLREQDLRAFLGLGAGAP